MSNFDLSQILKGISPGMIINGLTHPFRTLFHVIGSGAFGRSSSHLWRLPKNSFVFLGDVVQSDAVDNHHLTVKASRGSMRLALLAGDVLQVRVRPDGTFPETFSYAVEKPEAAWDGAQIDVSETDDHIELSTGEISLTIDKHPCRLTLRDQDGGVLLSDEPGSGYRPDGGQVLWRARLNQDCAFYGLGEKAGALNHAGQRFELWNTDQVGYHRGVDPLYMSVPFLMALSGGWAVGLFFDNTYRAALDVGASTPGTVEYRAAGGEFRLYIMAGTPQSVLQRYTEITGRTKVPPLWSLGFHQSRWSYYPEQRVMEIARQFRRRRLPCDVIHLDIHYMDGYRCFTWNKERFPNPRSTLANLHDQGFKVISIIDPGIKIDTRYRVYREGKAADVFIKYPNGAHFIGPVWPGRCCFPDFANPDVRTWWGDLYRGLLDDGIDAFWNDMNEPALITGQTGQTVPGCVCHVDEAAGAAGQSAETSSPPKTDHDEYHNIYGMLMVKASVGGLGRLRPDRRPLILSRSGWAGLQRHAIHWTGDNKSTWDHLRLSVQMVLSLGMSGIPITGPDIGGFTGGPTPELFARWMQVGAFMPFFRVHCMQGAPDQEPWEFGPEVEDISRRYIELRYRLLPYLYTAVWQTATTGAPIARPLCFAYPDDERTYSLDDQYLWGDSFLVAPVLEEGAVARSVYLPAGEWYDFWSHRQYQGGQTVDVEAPLERLPLFIKAGAIIPLWPVQQYVGEQAIDTLTLRAYRAAGEHTSLHYEDDGLCPDYELSKNHRLSHLVWRSDANSVGSRIAREIRQGQYQSPAQKAELQIIGLEDQPTSVKVHQGKLIDQRWEAGKQLLTLTLEAPEAFEVHL
ncbi:MAG: glycoside hydrolase family 31 protein [Anaerolineae bacterium]|nr:glycoside hydrolase family 31 protein [Anaerolineae bacterium]